MSDSYYDDAIRKFFFFVADACEADISTLNPDQFVGYHRQLVTEQIETRQDLEGYFKYLYNQMGDDFGIAH